MYDRAAMKAHARERMRVSDPRCWKMMLVWMAAAVAVPTLIQNLAGNSVWEVFTMAMNGIDPSIIVSLVGSSFLVGAALGIVIWLYQMVMKFGLTNYTLKLHRGEDCGAEALFGGFAMVGRVIGAQILYLLRVLAVSMIGSFAASLLSLVGAMISEWLGVVLMALSYVALLVAVVIVVLRYVLIDLVLADEPERTAGEAVARSAALMQGNKWRWVVLNLSFLGWQILCNLLYAALFVLSGNGLLPIPDLVYVGVCLVALLPTYLWLQPYMSVTYAAFYDQLKKEHDQPQPPVFEPLEEFPEF